MKKTNPIVVFTLDRQRYALDLCVVERVDRIVEITPLPKAPDIVLGVVNVRGDVIPVVNIRKRFRLPEREISLSDQLIIANTSARAMALVVDEVIDVIAVSGAAVIDGDEILPGMDYVEGVLKLSDGMVLIHDLEKFLSFGEAKALEESMQQV